ncbi:MULTISPECIES: NAD(P)H-dependent flavin oxidoreductase [Blautia]|jgi:nitronate monooxygenase|uniref:Probable nitronate monooxygenase n=2 Tax=Blautia TaxID=572511 RepID=A0ABQ0BSN1_9FIRM|nr:MULTISPECIES: nitronate monooxygenase family protein [Blautia]MCI5964833.1 nitronate monooxygenase family protein [Clostridia bacterium]MCQ4738077.1 nitronate monooxygenase family protein [Blautia hominis]MBC5672459.1 nitronate monooxygenase [Blautia celeris]MCB4353198.1 nitronate monooxygenase family protein [Blautia sp. RD014232]MCB6192386.1 nitronate monooxygenase family protein [Blautia marasmi]
MRKPLMIGDLTAKIPVIQGGMGVGISLSRLAGSVAACGGVGVISTAQIGWREPDFREHPFEANYRAIGKEIQKAREIAEGGIIGVNIMVATQRYEEYVKTAVKAGVDLIISGAGLPIDLPKYVEGTKTKIAPIVSSLKSLNVICRMWERKYKKAPDLVVIEGPKAGGHLGFSREELDTFTDESYDGVIRSIIEKVKEYGEKFSKKIPVVVAGGIYDRADMDHALSLGADGVQMGTRFVTTEECDAAPEYKQAYIRAEKEDICIVQSPVGMPGRAIKNAFMDRVKTEKCRIEHCYHCIVTCRPAEIPYCITQALVNAAEGRVEDALLFCGSNACRSHKIEKVEDIMKELG